MFILLNFLSYYDYFMQYSLMSYKVVINCLSFERIIYWTKNVIENLEYPTQEKLKRIDV